LSVVTSGCREPRECLEDLRRSNSEALDSFLKRLGPADFEQAEEQVLDGDKFILSDLASSSARVTPVDRCVT